MTEAGQAEQGLTGFFLRLTRLWLLLVWHAGPAWPARARGQMIDMAWFILPLPGLEGGRLAAFLADCPKSVTKDSKKFYT